MDDTAKYLIHASITADGVVERSDVVGAIFGQTEGLLGDDLDLRDLQQSSKVGRIDVEIESEHGESNGRVTIASSLDKVETAILAASLETITRVGPCRSSVTVTDIEDVREAKRREVVERAKELLASSFDDSIMTSSELLEEVRESVRVEDITDYRGFPAGPRVADSDAIIVVEGRADVLTLLRYGIKNAVAVEGTNVPDTVAELTKERTVTAFLDGDRGGELILRELLQVGDVDYVAFAPEGRSVEDLTRSEVMASLREKVPFETLPEDGNFRAAVTEGLEADPLAESPGRTATDPPTAPTPRDPSRRGDGTADAVASGADPSVSETAAETDGAGPAAAVEAALASGVGVAAGDASDAESERPDAPPEGPDVEPEGPDVEPEEPDVEPEGPDAEPEGPTTLREHVAEVVDAGSGRVRLLDAEFAAQSEAAAEEAFDELERADPAPYAVVLDGELSQRLLDVAAQRGIEHVVAGSTGQFVKKPVDVRVRTAEQLS